MCTAILTAKTSSFAVAYRQALTDYVLNQTGEEALMQAYELGRRAVAEHCNILDLVATHQSVLLKTVLEEGNERRAGEYMRRGENFLAEVMAPFEMMHRGFSDTIRQLREVNATLEQRVDIRTRALEQSRRKTADLARLYQILSSINSAIVRLRDRLELFKEACKIAVEQGGYLAAGINTVDRRSQGQSNIWYHRHTGHSDDDALLHPSLSADVRAAIDGVYSRKQPVIWHSGSKDLASKNNTDIDSCSCVLLPLLIDEKVIGVFFLFSDQEEAFAEDERRLLSELAGDISFALDHIHKEERLNYLAYHDILTGLPNQNLLLERLSYQLQAADRTNSMVALLMVDLIHFSDVNDTYGRHVGDNLLRQVGDRLCAAIGSRETVARLGADRFALTLSDLIDAGQVAHRLEQEVLGSFIKPFAVDGTEMYITVQVGLALYPSDAQTADTLYKNSQIALKRAQSKQEPYLLYDRAMNERIIHPVTLEAKLRKAIDTEALLVHYQPKVATTDGSIVGMEALLRYDDPDEGLVFPGTFIPLMEETGMINEIGAWVMRQAAEDVEKWRRMNLKPPRIAVNVSPVQLRQKNFLELVEAMIPESAGDHGLDIEITESAVMADISENIPKLAAVRERGFSIAVDDFGTGYSSLNYLSRLPVDTLKIDRSFIIDMTEHPNSLSIVTTIITLAHALDLKVVAEGVDDEEQAKLLRLLRCDQIQGNLCSRPLSWEEITSRLHEKNSCIIQPRSRPSPYP